MSWNDLTDRQKELDRAIEQCEIKLVDSTTCLSKVMRAIDANPTEASFVKARINLRLKTKMALERADDLAQFQRLFSDINLHVMSLRFGDFRVGTTDFVFVTWIHSGCEDGYNAV